MIKAIHDIGKVYIKKNNKTIDLFLYCTYKISMKYDLKNHSNFCLEQEYKETKNQMKTNNNLSEFFYISKQNKSL